MQNFGVTNKEHMVCYGIFWSGQLDFSTIKLQVITIRFFYYNLISSITTNKFFMSISFFLMYVFQFFFSLGWAPRMNPSVPFAPFPFGHKSQSSVFKFFFIMQAYFIQFDLAPKNMEYVTSHLIYFLQSTSAKTTTITNINKRKQTKI